MANWWDKNLTDKQKFRLQEPKDPSLLDVVSTVPNPVGDVASGLLAAQDVSKGNYGTAALNAAGLLPFVPSMGAIVKNTDTFEQLAKTGKMRQAKNKEQELNDLISGKSKFAEVRLNWDDPKTYDLADKLKAQGFDSTVTQQGKDMVTLFHKSAEDISPVLNAKTPYDFGKAYGYSDNDIAAFYNNRYGKDAEKYWKQDSKFLPAKTEFELAQNLAQQRAALPMSEGGLGLPATNTAMDRAASMGYTTPAYHATNSNIKSFIPSDIGTYGAGVYTAKHPEIAEGYYQELINSNTIPLLINKGKEKQFQSFSDYVGQKGKGRNTFDYGQDLRNEGYNSLNVKFFPEGEVREYASFNPSDVRSRFAAFDPFRRNEADILAGVGVGVPVASGLLDIEDKKVPKKEKKKTK